MALRSTTFCLLMISLIPNTGRAQDDSRIVDEWRYALRRPPQQWRQPKFDDGNWQQGFGGFGTRETPGARVGTIWATNNIWMRKKFVLKSIPAKPALLIHHDEGAEVFVNGRQIAALKGFTTKYIVVPFPADQRSVLKKGSNVLAVHCRQTGGGQFIDVHVIDADRVPELPAAQRSQKPFQSELITKWGEQVTPENAWTEYPRPQLQRDDWTNLNGLWKYAITSADQLTPPTNWAEDILVPFCLESKLGGVQRLLDGSEALWYRRSFQTKTKPAGRTLLHFEAVDYRCQVFVNGKSVGTHVGGHTPFSFDVTDQLREETNELIVRVEDDTEGWQLRGKQVLNARGIWYTQVSGIWQTVWLEHVPATYIADLKFKTDSAAGGLEVNVQTAGQAADDRLQYTVILRDGQQTVAHNTAASPLQRFQIPDAKLWSPDTPFLYDVTVILSIDNQPFDEVQSYVGIRSVGKQQDADGNWRFTLNEEPIFHWGPLDQGWWPDGLLTPPSDEAMQFEIDWLKKAGFNMIRKHIKVEPRRYYYHCDRMGMLVWQDHVSGGEQSTWPEWTRLKPNPVDSRWPDDQHQQFMVELERMIDALENHPSIVSWVPLNERWGQHRTLEIGRWTVERDPSRLVNIASGGNFWPVGDVVDAHSYPHPEFPFDQGQGGRFEDYIKVMGEFGGHGYPVPGHLWDANRRNWGYGGLPENLQEYKERYITSLEKLDLLRERGIAAGVYTQTTDVEGEINGLMTYDRKVIKIPADELAKLHRQLFPPATQDTPQ